MKHFANLVVSCMAIAASAQAALVMGSTQICRDSDLTNCVLRNGLSSTAVSSWQLGDQLFNGSASAVALENLWRLGFSVSMVDYERANYTDRGLGAPTMAAANMFITDAIRVSGGTGLHSLAYVFSVDGSLSTPDVNLANPKFCASLATEGGARDEFPCATAGQNIPAIFTLTLGDLAYDRANQINMLFSIFGSLQPVCPDSAVECFHPKLSSVSRTVTMDFSADFSNTIRLLRIEVRDNQGDPVSGLTFTSAGNYAYNVSGASYNIPEPSTFAFGVLAMVAAGVRKFVWR